MKTVDTRGEKCPVPIIKTRKALRETSAGESFEVLTDSSTVFRNISRFLSDNGIKYSLSEKKGIWRFEVANEKGGAITTEPADYCETEVTAMPKGDFAVVITSESMGEGDAELGKKLMKSFFISLSCLERLPSLIVFYNSGVKLASGSSDIAELLLEIERKGVEIILCGTCTDHFGITDKIVAGKTGDMYLILNKLSMMPVIIRP